MASSPAVICSPDGDDRIVFARVMQRRGLAHPAHELVGLAGHGRDDDRDLLPASTSRLTWRATLRMRSTLATDVPPNFITRTVMAHPPQATVRSLLMGALGFHERRESTPEQQPEQESRFGRGSPIEASESIRSDPALACEVAQYALCPGPPVAPRSIEPRRCSVLILGGCRPRNRATAVVALSWLARAPWLFDTAYSIRGVILGLVPRAHCRRCREKTFAKAS